MSQEQIPFEVDGLVRSIDQLQATSKTIVVFEGSDRRDPTKFRYEHAHTASWFRPVNIQRKRVWIEVIRDIQPDRHPPDLANYLFADGHVQTIDSAQIQHWADVGYDFARPGQASRDP
ncbi:hypothetical protein OAS39_04335 [Pirellulales bacterium]|nr:hypothetical protein [Pirellulales bacterium]